MKRQQFVFKVLVLIAPIVSASAQDHLVPDTGRLANPDSYQVKIRFVFDRAFEKEVTLRAIVVPSFRNEYAVGLKTTEGGIEAFVLEPSSHIWATEVLKLYENGQIVELDSNGKEVPLEKDEDYKKLKKETPADLRKIQVVRQACPIPKDLAKKIQALWDGMLLGVQHPPESDRTKDGVTYHFSAWLRGRGNLSGHCHSPKPDSKSARLASLADALADYSKKKIDLKQLNDQEERATRP